jgi:hypothetical protein
VQLNHNPLGNPNNNQKKVVAPFNRRTSFDELFEFNFEHDNFKSLVS